MGFNSGVECKHEVQFVAILAREMSAGDALESFSAVVCSSVEECALIFVKDRFWQVSSKKSEKSETKAKHAAHILYFQSVLRPSVLRPARKLAA